MKLFYKKIDPKERDCQPRSKVLAIMLAASLTFSFATHTTVCAQTSSPYGTTSTTQPTASAPQTSPPAQTAPSTAQANSPQAQPTSPATEFSPLDADENNPILPHELTPMGMFLAADYIVKAVMIGLAFASVVTWSVWLAKTIELLSARRKLMRDL
ncbi:MAG: hypothetical protein ABIO35_02790, partial [Nitrobacter sp.]